MKQKISKTFLVIFICFIFYILYSCFHVGLLCPFLEFTGFYCPGCGITRAIDALIHFDFLQAYRYNPLVISLLPFAIPLLINSYYCWFFDKKNNWLSKIPNWFLYILLIITILFGILRNFSSFSFLAPTKI